MNRLCRTRSLACAKVKAAAHRGDLRRLDVLPEEAAVVREAYRLFLSGQSLVGVTRHLERQGYPTRTGVRWMLQAVRRILRSPISTGYLVRISVENREPMKPDAAKPRNGRPGTDH